MKLISLELYRYTRLYVSGIKHIVYTPDKSFNIILGRNGSGKSSLVKEIFPNVDELKNDYDAGGYKILKLNHNNKTFTIIYKRDKNYHSFLIDGEEHNQQHIQKTQRILIEQYFGLTKPIYEMMLSNLNFTSMSVSERKRWFTNILTTVDFDYALKLYNNTKIRIKELTSFMKLVQSKLIKNADLMKELNPDNIARLEQDRDKFYIMMEELTNNIIPVKVTTSVDKHAVTRHVSIIEKVIDKLEYGKDASYYSGEINKLRAVQNTLKDTNVGINKKLNKIDNLKIDNTVSLKDLEDMLLKIDEKIDEYNTYYKTRDVDALRTLVSNFNNNYTHLLTSIETILPDKDIEIVTDADKHKLLSLEADIKSLTSKYLVLDKEFIKQLSFKEQTDVTCPKCSNIFKPNFNNDNYLKTKDELQDIIKKKDGLNNEYETLLNKVNAYNVFYNNKNNLIRLLDSCCPTILDFLNKETNGLTYLDNLLNKVSDIKVHMPTLDTIDKLLSNRTELLSKINVYKQLSSEKLSYIANRKNELIEERIANINKINELEDTIEEHRRSMKRVNIINESTLELQRLIKHNKLHNVDVMNVTINRYIDNVIAEIKKEVIDINTKLLEYDRLKQNNDELELELKEYSVKLEAVKKLEVMLSPNKGVIGESINTTMNVILNRMNDIIEKVWSYYITILPCDISENDLTFRFPVKINNVKEIPDISKGSSSIKDIIDLAFKITAMEFLEMLDYPLILDELGSTFSSSHRVSVYDFIDELSKGYFNQIFMISHFEDMFGRFASSDVVVLDNEGINYTGTHNNVISIK